MWKIAFLILLCFYLTAVLSAPFQFPLLQPLQGTLEQQRLALEEQMFALQRFQALQAMNFIPAATNLNNPPILIVFPNSERELNTKTKTKEKNKTGYEDEETDAVVINSDHDYKDDQNINDDDHLNDEERVKAVLLVPNARGIIGDIITGIPFLPIEVNVPDSIAWLYKWFSDLIAGWGSQQARETQMALLKRLKMKQKRPLMMLPMNYPYF